MKRNNVIVYTEVVWHFITDWCKHFHFYIFHYSSQDNCD